YEIVGLLTIFLFTLTGLALRASLAPLLLLLVILNLGYMMALMQVLEDSKAVIWTCVSAFLAATTLFYAVMLAHTTQARLDWLLRGYLAAAVVASIAGIVGYFQLSGALSELFLRS